MPKSKQSKTAGQSKSTGLSSKRTAKDAIALLKADHKEVDGWFGQFEKSKSDAKKAELATKICTALKVHTQIEEEIFYPPFYDATGDKELHHEAIIEHDAAKSLIAEIEASSPEDDYFEAKVKVLSEMIKHHVKEEEQPGGMFAEARKSEMDLKAIGAKMAARKKALMSADVKATPQRTLESRSESQVAAH